MSDNIWFTSDTHFWHKGILRFDRGQVWGDDVEKMTNTLIDNWNSFVQRGDRVYHLGDFALGSKTNTSETIARLKGQIHLVKGNHDSGLDSLKDRFASYGHYKEITIDGQKICMSHYPFMTWNQAHHGSWMLHGHCHGMLQPHTQPRYDVGVDPNNYQPISFEEVRTIMADRVYGPVDNHGQKP